MYRIYSMVGKIDIDQESGYDELAFLVYGCVGEPSWLIVMRVA